MDAENKNKNLEVGFKINNYTQNRERLLRQLKLLVIFESILGVNRLFLYDYGKWVQRISFVYNVLLVLLAVILLFVSDILQSTLQLLYKDAMAIEYILLALVAVLQQKTLKKFLFTLQSFDEKLNLGDNIFFTISTRYLYLVIAAILSYNIIENVTCWILFFGIFGSSYSTYTAYFDFIIRESETAFICILLYMVLKRLCVIRAHVAKLFCVKAVHGKNCTNHKKYETKLKDLTKYIDLDVTSLHKAYDSLHRCSKLLNTFISVPMLIMLVTTGLSTIMVFKNLILQFQANQNPWKVTIAKALVTFGAGRCMRSLLFLTLPCYYANMSKKQVNFIRNMIHDTLNTKELDKIERRKIKALFQLMTDCNFGYSLFGLVRLDMSLPLSYLNLCLTYLIIVVQFSKVLD